ncbi:MOSC and FAD-binding oxidoreductase domain-containing protein [Mycolicibacterium confluentis]|uniref:MOSC and FAD-binding oxidoreductase domain-containing protein n=1 Tax=Mycolicibacterium confluentis TaxID=28047 RepID=UPI000A150D01|nr:MOSC and FAD-binding oxidoreductase domain-containing protein [Mycolicibacterium confluentis]MCV7322997.1 MOSC domain-containing protein [Mycolicibacterium confluentis]ORV33339.1 sulfurase [Mycolicibacterium confluentis]
MPRLISVNVGMPRDVQWRDKTVHTGIWKSPVRGPVMVRRHNIDGDGQGDLAGHGGEQRAVMVYQQESYQFWRRFLNRDDLAPGSFGENFTITGLADDEVCVGDRFRIGDAEFEVTQPRVTCFRVGLRLDEPRMPQLLVSQRRPGFYLRVTVEGEVQTGDEIVRTRDGRHHMSVADVDALLYLPERNIEQLRKIVDVPALSPGWQQSFRELLAAHDGGAASAGPSIGAEPGWNGFQRLRVCEVRPESTVVLSISLDSGDGGALPSARPGQYLTVRIPDAGSPVPMRSYSLSSDSRAGRYRISVKREDRGLVSRWLHDHAEVGTVIEAAAPRGDFYLTDGAGPVVLLSAGIGITPVLAMLNSLASDRSTRTVWWLHTVRSRASEAFAPEVKSLIETLPQAHCRVFYTDTDGRLDEPKIAALELPVEATVYLCGPVQYMTDMREALLATGFDDARIHTELFGALPPIHPGMKDPSKAPSPHPPPGPPGVGPAVTFARSGLAVPWHRDCANILDFAEACDVPTRFSCRSGVCHVCATGVISGSVEYTQQPLELPGAGTALICSAVPGGDVVLDL